MRGWDPVACPGIGSDPDTDAEYDVVFLSTGLVESVAAAALAAVGKKVLQIEKTEHYGSSTWSTLELTAGGGRGEGDERGDRGAGDGEGTAPPPPFFVPVVSHASPVRPTPVLSHSPSTFSIHVDLNPRVAYADGPLISLLLASGAHNHTEFVFCKTVVWSDGAFVGVAASKGDVFKDESLTLSQKNSLMRALKGLAEEGTPWGKVSSLLDDAQLTSRIVHGACLADDRRTMDRLAGALLATYGRSIGKYGKTTSSSPFLYPKYGVGELCSAFSRRAAVAGAVQMLRCDARVEVARGECETIGGTERGQFFHVHVRGDDGIDRRVSAAAVVGGPTLTSCLPARSNSGGNNGTMRTIHCVALVRGRLIGRHPDSNNYLAAFPGSRTTWMLQLDGSSGCCDLDGHTVVQLWTSPRERRASRAHASPPRSLVDEFREILLRHFDCSQIFGDVAWNPPTDGAPRIEALWTGEERGDGFDGHPAPENITAGIITDYDGRLARDGLASFVGLAEEAERLFRRVCNDDGVPFPFGERVSARDHGRDHGRQADSDDSEERMLGELSDLLYNGDE